MTDFAAVDAGDDGRLVAMMDATDAWPAVRALRRWLLAQTHLASATIVLDVGCGPGTFGGMARAPVVDVDRSRVMLQETRRRRDGARLVLADIAQLPVRDGSAALVRAERVLQWTVDPDAALAELWRATAADGLLAVTDTDWATFRVGHADPAVVVRLTDAALTWVPHARVARELTGKLTALGARDVRTRLDTVVIAAWDPDDPWQRDGPPGLPLRSIAPQEPATLEDLARRAREESFRAEVTLVTCVARR
jgi:SAM-dependent methyltransferase